MAWGLVLLPLLAGYVAAWLLGQDANWDLRNYHWYNGYAWLTGRLTLDVQPSQFPSFYNPLLDGALYWLGTRTPPYFVSFMLGAVQGLNMVLVALLAHAFLPIHRPTLRALLALGLAVLGFVGAGQLAMLGTTFYDNIVSLGPLLALVLLCRFWPKLVQATGPTNNTLLAAALVGLPAGLALGAKLTIVPACVALLALWWFFPVRWSQKLAYFIACGVGLGLGLLATGGFWFWHLWVIYDNPLFPYFNHVFQSPLAPIASGRDVQFIPGDTLTKLIFPFLFSINPKLVGEIDWQDFRVALLYTLLPLLVLVALCTGRRGSTQQSPHWRQGRRLLLWFIVISYLVWLPLFSIYRYLVFIELLAPLAIMLLLWLLPAPNNIKGLMTGVVLLALLLTLRPGDWGRTSTPSTANQASSWVTARVPTINNPAQTMLLVVGYQPISFVIPAFPPAMPVVRISSNFVSSPDAEHGFNRLIAARVYAHKGNFLLLTTHFELALAKQHLAYYGLIIDGDCAPIPNNLYEPPILCPVQRLSAPQ